MNGKIILVEGCEATGKSTLCKNLVEKYNGFYYHCPSGLTDVTKEVYKLIGSRKMAEETKKLLIMATHIENINNMNKLKKSGETIICDRSLLSAYAYQHFSLSTFFNFLSDNGIPQLNVDHTFVLTANIETIKERLNKRGKDTGDIYFLANMERIINKYNNDYDELYPNAHKLNTTIKDKETIFKKVVQIIEN